MNRFKNIFLHLLKIYSTKLMRILSSVLLPQHTFLFQFLFETDAKSSPGCPPRLVVVSYRILIQHRCQMLSWRQSSSCGGCLCKSYIELIEFTSGTPILLHYKFPVKILYKVDEFPLLIHLRQASQNQWFSSVL